MDCNNKQKALFACAGTFAAGTLAAWYAGGGSKALYDFQVNEYSTSSKEASAWFFAYMLMPAILGFASGVTGYCAGAATAAGVSSISRPRWLKSCWESEKNDQEASPEASQEQAVAMNGLGV